MGWRARDIVPLCKRDLNEKLFASFTFKTSTKAKIKKTCTA